MLVFVQLKTRAIQHIRSKMRSLCGKDLSIVGALVFANVISFVQSFHCDINRNCTGSPWDLVFLQESSINYLRISDNSSISEIYQNNLHRPSGLTSNVRNGEVYWTAIVNGEPVVYVSSITGKFGNYPFTLVNTGLYQPMGISCDWISRNIYVVDGKTNQIVVCPRNYNKDHVNFRCGVVIKEQTRGTLYDISVDPNEGLMFWTVNKLSPAIRKSRQDGTMAVSLVTTDIQSPMAICVDGSRVYWTDSQKNTIESINYDGSQRKVLVTSAYNAWGIGVLGDFLYWSYPGENEAILKGVNKHNGENRTEVLFEYLSRNVSNMRDITFMDISTQPVTRNNTSYDRGCSHFTVFSGPVDVTCLCPAGMVGDGTETGTGCTFDTEEPTAFVAQGSTLLGMRLDIKGVYVAYHVYIPEYVQSIDALVYNPLDTSLIFYDGVLKKIFNYKYETEELELLLENDILNVVSLDLDLLNHNLFFLDAETNQIELFSLRTKTRKVVYKNIKNANQIVYDLGTIYVSNTGSTGTQQIRAILLEDPVKNDLVKSFDSAHPLVQMTCDRVTHKLVIMSSDGSNVKIESGRNAFSLDINGGRIDATAKINNRFIFLDQTSELKMLTFRGDDLDDKYLLDRIPIHQKFLISNKTKKHLAVNPGSKYMKDFQSRLQFHVSEANVSGAGGTWFWVTVLSMVSSLLIGVIGYLVWHFGKTRRFYMAAKPFSRKLEDEDDNENGKE